jgi:hypothetical protein
VAVERAIFLREFTRALREGDAALFVGAGVSRAAGYVDWKALLRDIAEDLHLDIDRESDLVTLAQYHVNQRGGRDRLNQLLIDEFLEHAEPTRSHHLIASLPITTVWTTNYDSLLEAAFDRLGKRVDVKRRRDDFGTTRRRTDVTLYKMHGDRTLPAEAVITKEDYESYDETREVFTTALKGDLVKRTFLFLGFSFSDPNIMYILGRVKQLLEGNSRQHFCVMRRPRPDDCDGGDYVCRRFDHWLADLHRYKVQAVLIDRYEELTDILEELNRRSHLRDVFISGSATDFAPLGEEAFRHLCHSLGAELMRRGFNIICGYGLGVGDSIIAGAMQALPRNDDERLQLWPFPQQLPGGMDRAAFWTDYRQRMIAGAGVCVVLAGNKVVDGATIPANGVREEIAIARAQGKPVIPIGATGHVARELWEESSARPADFVGVGAIAEQLGALGNEATPIPTLVNAVIEALRRLDS